MFSVQDLLVRRIHKSPETDLVIGAAKKMFHRIQEETEYRARVVDYIALIEGVEYFSMGLVIRTKDGEKQLANFGANMVGQKFINPENGSYTHTPFSIQIAMVNHAMLSNRLVRWELIDGSYISLDSVIRPAYDYIAEIEPLALTKSRASSVGWIQELMEFQTALKSDVKSTGMADFLAMLTLYSPVREIVVKANG